MRSKAAGLTLVVLICLLVIGLGANGRDLAAQNVRPERVVVREVDYLGQVSLATGLLKDETEIGGLSALTYDPLLDVYYVLSDDRSVRNPARFYTVSIAISDGILSAGDVVFDGVTTLLTADGQPFPAGGIDPEGIALSQERSVFISSEDALINSTAIDPSVSEFNLNGRQLRQLTIPDKFIPNADNTSGVRNNLSFESLTLMPNARHVLTAVESALLQDGPIADVDQPSLSRILWLDVATGLPLQEQVYITGPAEAPVTPTVPHGLVEMVSLDNNGSILTLERGPSDSFDLTVRLYSARSQGALDVAAVDSLFWNTGGVPYEIDPPVVKELLLDFADLGLPFVNNFEGMALGPVLPDGRQTLILVSDNNFSPAPTQFLALALTLETVPAAIPSLETPLTHDDAAAPAGVIAGDSDDPAIWLDPNDAADSLVAVTLKDGGLMVLDLTGAIRQTIAPPVYGDVRYNNVDVVYNFPLGGETADLFIVSDRRNDTLAVFRIDPDNRLISDVTSVTMPATIFGVDDGEQTVYGLAAYTSSRDGRVYTFVTQAAGNLVAQLMLSDDGSGFVTADIVRTLELPMPTGVAADSQSEGIVVDRFLRYLYIAMENGVGIVKFNAEPDGGEDYTVIHTMDEPFLQPDIKGLTIYYGAGDSGYLLVSSQGDHTYAVLSRADGNAYLGSFIIADEGKIDQANESDGADVTNVALGPLFPNGLLIVQDGANDPQNAVPDGEHLENNSTNFKFVRWDSVAGAFLPGLLMDTGSYNPRYPMRTLLPTISGN